MLRRVGLFALAMVLCLPVLAAAEDGFVSIFDGKTLEGWNGDPKFWSVKDGAITGQTTEEVTTKGNTFIIWKGGEIGDFELKLQFKMIGGNSGIQYRSFKLENGADEWRIGGYQADFESGDRYSGICYGEAFRGILSDRGDKTVLTRNDGKFIKTVVGSVGDPAGLGSYVKKEEWNEYHITARGFRFVHKINGQTMTEFVDNDEEQRRPSGLLALQLHAGPPMNVQFRNILLKKSAPAQAAASGEKKKVVFVAGTKSHGYGSHEHFAGCTLLAKSLSQALPNYEVNVIRNGWPKDESVFDGVDCVVMYADGGGNHPVIPHAAKMDAMAKKGVGVACIHYGVEVPKGEPGDHFLNWIGGYFETHWSVNPHWVAKFEKFPDHPIANGVQPFEADDEWYYHMRFREGMKNVTPILTAMPGPETLKRNDGAHSGNPHVRAAVLERKEAQHVAWASENAAGGRGFGFTGGHNHWNWGNANFRKLVLNAIVWCSKGDVPASGVGDEPVTLENLEQNQDYTPPNNFNRDAVRQQFKLSSTGRKTTKLGPGPKPVFSSKVITPKTPEHSVAIDVDIKDAKQLFLVVTDGGNGFGCDWADWAEPRLVGPDGEKKLTELKWKSASADFGDVLIGKNNSGGPLKIAGKSVAYGIGTHANSMIAFDLPAGFTRFKATGGLDGGGTGQQACGEATSVQFHVFTQAPGTLFVAQNSGGGGEPASHDAADAVKQLAVHESLQVSLFASEPMMLNPTNIDIDHLGRVWVCEVINYRAFANKAIIKGREDGDKIIILEDANGDGKADKVSTYYQGSDIDSAHGICVLPTVSGKGTRALVSAKDSVFYLIDDDGDLKCDRKEVLFTGISGAEHDHGIHAFVFGPDGKLYFNFGNAGKQIKDKDGKPIVDLAGNTVNDGRKPYQEGMVFRCNMDGSEFETLAWNFRNNWEVSVDSFGTLWQSDNDDDGNKGVRINFVMEFGNYGYKDEFTGAGWKQERTGMHKEIPLQHWHLNDPGVVPNLVQTGAGSPTGICVYEGSLLPKMFQGQTLHCDAGPNIVRCYPAKTAGAGYEAKMVSVIDGASNKWFRPTDVCVAPDGSVLVSDWYDPGVGGHRMGDINHGRIFRLTPKGHDNKYAAAKQDFSTVEGAIKALGSPNLPTRYMAWKALHDMGAKAEPGLIKLTQSEDPRQAARAMWLLGKIEGRGAAIVDLATSAKNPNLRILGIRLARQLKQDVIPIVGRLGKDPSAAVRRELAIALRHNKSDKMPELWTELALQHDGQDRWYLEALGISADRNWDVCLDAWMKRVGKDWATPAGRDIIWRSRAKQTPSLLAKIVKDEKTPTDTHPRYMRAFDFLSGPEKEKALEAILLDL